MSAVVDAVSSVVSDVVDAVGSVAQTVVSTASDVLAKVDDAAHSVVNSALQDPIGTIAKVAAIASGQPELIPAISAADIVAHGGSLEDAAKSAATSYVAQGVGNYVGDQISTAAQYGTDIGSAQTAQLAAQSGDMLSGTAAGTLGGAAGAAAAGTTAAVLSGGNVDQAIINALGNYAARTGISYGFNAAGQLVDQNGNPAPTDAQSQIAATADSMRTDNPTIVNNLDGTYTQTFDDGSTQTFRSDGTAVSSTTTSGDVVPATSALQPSTPVDQPPATDFTANPTIVQNPDGSYTQTFDDGTTQTFDKNGNVISATTTDGNIIYPGPDLQPSTPLDTPVTDSSSLNWGGVSDYFKNQFAGALANNFISSLMPGGTAAPSYARTGLPFSPMVTGFNVPTETPPSNVGYNIGEQASLASMLPEQYLKEDTKSETSDALSADAAEYARQKFLESQFYDAPTEYAADGGPIGHSPQFFSEGGAGIQHRYVKGGGDGTSDSVPAMLASGEFVIPADVVSSLGNGDNDAGASVLDQFMQQIRSHKRSSRPDKLPPDSKGPLSYLKEANKKVKKHGRS